MIAGLVAVLVLAIAVPLAMAANQPSPSTIPYGQSQFQEKWSKLTDSQKKEISDIQQQIKGLQQKLIDKYQSFGLIDKSQANIIKDHINDMYNYMRNGGCGGFGMGMMGGYGYNSNNTN